MSTTQASAQNVLGSSADDGGAVTFGGARADDEVTVPIFEFTVNGTAKPKGSMRHVGNGRLIEQVKGSTAWKEHVRKVAVTYMNGRTPIAGPVDVIAVVSLERPKSHKAGSSPVTRSSGDIDKLARNLLDAISGVVVRDDSQVIRLTVTKRYQQAAEPCTYLRVEPSR